MNDLKEVVFKGRIIKKMYDGGDYKVFAVDVNRNIYSDIKLTKYGNATINGEMQDLTIGVEYEIKAIEQNGKYGYGYKVLNIRTDKPHSSTDMYVFLQEILTIQQADTLYNAYPDIVERVLENRLDDVDLNKLKGIKEYTFNIIKNKIIENYGLAELVVEFQGFFTISMLKKLYDKYTSIEMIKQKIRENPYKCLCGLARVGFKTADGLILELEKTSNNAIKNNKEPIMQFNCDLKTSKERCLACVFYLLEENENEGHTKMDISELRDQCMKFTPACSQYFVECLKHKDIFYDKDAMFVSLKYTYKTEKFIAENIIHGLNICNTWNYDINKYKSVNGCELSDGQVKVLDLICKNNVCILNGAAGCGKSYSTQAIINMLKDNNKSFRLFSPTGKAAKVLSEYTKETATTIHRGLGYIPPDKWVYNEDHKLDCDVLIIDEFSMTDIFLFKKVIEALDFNKTKLLLIGDNAQLPSVSCGNLLHDFMQSNIVPTVTLTKVFRYGEGGLMKVATDVRFCKKYLDDNIKKFTYFGNNKDYAFINVGSNIIVSNAVALYKKLLQQGYTVEDIQVLTAYKKGGCGSLEINNQLQKIANPNYGKTDYMKIGDTCYFKGDIVIQNVNNYHAKIFVDDNWVDEDGVEAFIANGETGIIKDVNSSYVLIDFDGVVVKYARNDMNSVGLGYSITIHKSQGSSIRIVILLTPQSHTFMLNSNIIYVGLTRMKVKCFHLGNKDTVNIAIKKKANLVRNTWMQDLLKQHNKSVI